MINVEIELDSTNGQDRITTFVLEYPRFVHAEFMTHRVFSRNAASSRAIPVSTFINRVDKFPAEPVHWGKNQKGMQAKQELDDQTKLQAKTIWYEARTDAIKSARKMQELGVHKQIVNRLLEPWLNIQVVITATEFDNFFQLRAHPDAQPEIAELAYKMQTAMDASIPKVLNLTEWHIPFIREEEEDLPVETKLKISTARCARTSYYYHDGKKSTVKQDVELHDRLVGSKPIHASPTEHQGQAVSHNQRFANFFGFRQYRWYLERGQSV